MLPALDNSRVVPPSPTPTPAVRRPHPGPAPRRSGGAGSGERRQRDPGAEGSGGQREPKRYWRDQGMGGTRLELDTQQSGLAVDPCSVGRDGTGRCFHCRHPLAPAPVSTLRVLSLLAAPTPSSARAAEWIHWLRTSLSSTYNCFCC